MANGGETHNALEEKPEASKTAGDTALDDKKREVAVIAQDTTGMDATPLSTRKQPHEAPKAGEEDISGSELLKGTNANVLDIAKKNMTSKAEYGDLNEITVDNTQFILAKNADGVPYIRVNVYGESSGALITQSIPLQGRDADGALAYLEPPVAEGEESFVESAVSRLG